MFRSQTEIFVHGEALTLRSAAEYVNYLMLIWFLDKGQAHVYTQPNVIATDHVHPAVVHRIIAAVQEEPECGFTMTCRETGSCFAQNLHAGDNRCFDEFSVQRTLENMSNDHYFSWEVRYATIFIVWLLVKLSICYAFVGPSLLGRCGRGKGGTEKDPATADGDGDVAAGAASTALEEA